MCFIVVPCLTTKSLAPLGLWLSIWWLVESTGSVRNVQARQTKPKDTNPYTKSHDWSVGEKCIITFHRFFFWVTKNGRAGCCRVWSMTTLGIGEDRCWMFAARRCTPWSFRATWVWPKWCHFLFVCCQRNVPITNSPKDKDPKVIYARLRNNNNDDAFQ